MKPLKSKGSVESVNGLCDGDVQMAVVQADVLAVRSAKPDCAGRISVLMWLAATALLSLLILPRMKGAVVGCQWALRMHGFTGRADESRALGASGKAASRR